MTELESYFSYRCWTGLSELGHSEKQNYRDRLQYEIEAISRAGFCSYFLLVADILDWARNNGVLIGPGRGSASASLCVHCLGITHPILDPVRYNLPFSRFINPSRVSLPDIDIDIPDNKRDLVIQYIQDRYGMDNVSHIGTYGTLKARAAVREVTRVLNQPYEMGDKLCKLLLPPISGKPQDLRTCYEQVPELKRIRESSTPEGEILYWAEKLEGQIKSFGTHAGGIIISDKPIYEFLPLAPGKDKKPTSQFDMGGVEDVGLVKFDFLGIKALTTIQTCLNMIGNLDIHTISIDDKPTYQMLQEGDTLGIFQLTGSSGIRDLTAQLKPENLEDLSLLTALFRPGPLSSGMSSQVVGIRNGTIQPDYLLPELEPITRDTASVIIYQEQVMRISMDLAGFTPSEADTLRKCISGDSYLFTDNGPLLIKNLIEPPCLSKALGYKNLYHYSKVWCTDFQMTNRISILGYPDLFLTDEHQIPTLQGLLSVQQIKHLITKEQVWVEVDDCPISGNKEIDTNIIDLGIGVITEGYLPATKRTCTFTNTDLNFIKLMEQAAINLNIKFTKASDKTSTDKDIYVLRFNPKIFLEKVEITPGLSGEKFIPDEWLQFNTNLLKRIICLLFEAEGYITQQRVGFSTTSNKLYRQVQIILYLLGINFSTSMKHSKAKSGYSYSVEICSAKEVNKIQEILCGSSNPIGTKFTNLITRKPMLNFNSDRIPSIIWNKALLRFKQENNLKWSDFPSRYRTGSFTSKSPTRQKVEDLLTWSQSKNLKTLSIVDALQKRFAQINKISPFQLENVYDFEEDNFHLGVINGIVIHNSIGKKKPELMEQQRQKFIFGMECNGFLKEKAEKLFDTIEGFASYSFCSAHSLAYSLISYWMAYLKCHYPHQFICSCLITDSDNQEEISKYVNYCRTHGIDIKPPSINKSELSFSVREGVIRFGLEAIKNIGASARVILEERSSRPFHSFREFCQRVDTGKINRRKVDSLILAGAFDEFGTPRQGLLEEADNYWEYNKGQESYTKKLETYEKKLIAWNKREREIREYEQLENKKGVKRPGKMKVPAKPEAPIIPDRKIMGELPEIDRLKYERDLLGCYISGHPLDHVINRGITIEEIKSIGQTKQKVTLTAVPVIIEEKTTKKKTRMSSLILEDQTGTIEGVIWPGNWNKIKVEVGETYDFSLILDVVETDEARIVKSSITSARSSNKIELAKEIPQVILDINDDLNTIIHNEFKLIIKTRNYYANFGTVRRPNELE